MAIVTDIEGTTSSLSFVKDVLFPYARERIPAYVESHKAKLADILNEVRVIESNSKLTAEQIVPIFLRWMDEDKKITPLKTLQGLIWKAGYDAGELQGHIYDDALVALQAWHDQGLRLYIYSSGSVAAQKLLFGNTLQGDLTPLFSGYFDTTTGRKIEAFHIEKSPPISAKTRRESCFSQNIKPKLTPRMKPVSDHYCRPRWKKQKCRAHI